MGHPPRVHKLVEALDRVLSRKRIEAVQAAARW